MRRKAILLLAAMGAALVLSSGVALAAINTINCKANKPCYGTKARDLMKGSAGSDWMMGKGRADTLKGFGNSADDEELLYGQGGNDKLYGGHGWDILSGGPGNDALVGDDSGTISHDDYEFEANNWGDDTITDNASWDNTVHFRSGITTNLTINLNSLDLAPEVRNADGTSTVNWSGNVINDVNNQGTGDDTITGNDAGNRIQSIGFDPQTGIYNSGGADTILAGGGSDVINVDDGFSGDSVDCGEGIDTVSYNTGDTLVPGTCETTSLR